MSDDKKILKMEKDFSAEADKAIAEAKAAPAKAFAETIEALLTIEKKARLANDIASTTKLAVAVVELSMAKKDWKVLSANVMLLCKRRQQFKGTITKVIDMGIEYAKAAPDENTRIEFIETLRTVSAGKIFVEVQRARLTMQLAKIREKQGKIAEASEILQEVQVETFGSMEPREKTEFILEQMRLCLARKDLVRTQIISRKITDKVLRKEELQDLKLRYYKLLIEFYHEKGSFIDVTRSWMAIYDTPSVQADEAQWQEALKSAMIYLVLSPYDNASSDFLNRIGRDKNLKKLPVYHALAQEFLQHLVLKWPVFRKKYESELNKHSVFKSKQKDQRWKDLHKRVTEHNIRIVGNNYTRVTMKRLTELLSLSQDEVETYLSEQVVKGTVYARMDRPAGVVSFVKPQEPNDVLNAWSNNVSSLLNLVESTCHLIHRENVVHKIK